MNVLLIGGTGFIGPSTLAHLQKDGHHATVFHRGKTPPPEGAAEIIGDHCRLADFRAEFERGKFEVVIDFILSSERQARLLMQTFRGLAGRVVALSSIDVYRAMGIIHGTESGPLQELPLTEESELRTKRHTYSPEAMKKVQEAYPWVDDSYDKIPVEEAVLGDRELPGTVLRLPMVYGPGDPLHRFQSILSQMEDGRPAITFSEDFAAWRAPRGFNGNVGAAIALAAASDRTAGRTYNICEEPAFSELEWAEKIAEAVGWKGRFVVLPREETPQHLLLPFKMDQHLVASSARIRDELGYREPVALQEAIRLAIARP